MKNIMDRKGRSITKTKREITKIGNQLSGAEKIAINYELLSSGMAISVETFVNNKKKIINAKGDKIF